MLRSSTPPPPVGDTTQLRHQNDSQDNSKDRSTSDSAEKTTAAATEPPPEDAIVENVENPATMTEKTSALAVTVISSPDQRDLSKLIEMEDKFDDGYDSDGAIGPFWECLEEEGLSPLHARVMALFDSVKDSHHQCAMDNLYNSAAFCKAAVNHKRKVLCHGVTRKGARGIPPSVVQEEVKDRKKQIDVRGTVKAALLEGDPNCVGLVASSVYDTKPVHYLSMVCEELKWLEVEKQVYNVDTGKVESLCFLRMNTIDNYNKTMGNVDIADQLRGSYRVDHWIRNRKWWWSLWFWSLGVMLTNAYIMKCKVDMECGVDEKDLMSQHDFRKDVAEAWINPAEYAKEKGLKMTVTTNRKRKTITDADSSVSSVTMSTSSSVSSRRLKTSVSSRRLFTPRPEKRATAFTDDSLSPNGQLKIRLNVAADHYPIPPSSTRARCALHRWVDNESLKQAMKCTTCNVHLCIQCYKLYHTVPDLISIKQHLKKKYDTNKDA